jgi:hypothetical protein
MDYGTELCKNMMRTIMFPSGTEWMVCKKVKKGKVTEIYLREVELGLGQSKTAIWCDERIILRFHHRRNVWMLLADNTFEDFN